MKPGAVQGGNEIGERISDEQMRALDLQADAVCPKWNYTLRPRHGSMQDSHVIYC